MTKSRSDLWGGWPYRHLRLEKIYYRVGLHHTYAKGLASPKRKGGDRSERPPALNTQLDVSGFCPPDVGYWEMPSTADPHTLARTSRLQPQPRLRTTCWFGVWRTSTLTKRTPQIHRLAGSDIQHTGSGPLLSHEENLHSSHLMLTGRGQVLASPTGPGQVGYYSHLWSVCWEYSSRAGRVSITLTFIHTHPCA